MERYIINSPHVVSEVFADEEAAVINLKSGNYYSLNKTAAEIWLLIEKEVSFDDIADFIFDNYSLKESFNKTEIEEFIQKLIAEGLIAADQTPDSENGDHVKIENSAADSKEKREYEPPVLECYPDMQELLLLDPIHEVEETNWLINKSK